MTKTVIGVIDWAVKQKKNGRDLKSRIEEVEGLYYLSIYSVNKGVDQLCGHRAADLCLCFHISIT